MAKIHSAVDYLYEKGGEYVKGIQAGIQSGNRIRGIALTNLKVPS
jgi:hypothetical protein